MDESEESGSFASEVMDFFKDLVVIVVVVKVVTVFLVSVFIINGQSMYASYYNKEFILVDRFSTLEIWDIKKQKVTRGDVVVFRPHVDKVKEFFIKRVVWMPGDIVKIEWWYVYLKKWGTWDFIKLEESYLNKDNKWKTRGEEKTNTYIVPAEKYFLMWDNRNKSSDSRTCFSYKCSGTTRDHFIEKENVVGKVLLDLGYFNIKKLSFTHPNITTEEGMPIDTAPKWTSSPDSYTY